ncbi:hypothetical protein GMRT_14665 [Giardia muris]|uniref:Uncharacterized protein n=1 Tax=Giardia muris TaxID=5742 RepID=A0A4Z1SLL2_GIAMU|nr:hypothetical protein GMRT_14665 [Giardia muris]|eukprot:TNJ26420.1 hypothetical protein GMRT_14665 [Giardia muris]
MESNPSWMPFGSHGMCYMASETLTLTFLADIQALFSFPTICFVLWMLLLPLEYKAWLTLTNGTLISLEVYLLGLALPIPAVCLFGSELEVGLNYSFDPLIILVTIFSLSVFHLETPLKPSIRTWFYPTMSLTLLTIAGSISLLLGISNIFLLVMTVLASALAFYYGYVTPFAVRTIDIGILLGYMLLMNQEVPDGHLSFTIPVVGLATTLIPWLVVTLDRCSFQSLLLQAIMYPYFLALRKPLKRVSQRREYRPISCAIVYYLVLLLCLTQFVIYSIDFAFLSS